MSKHTPKPWHLNKALMCVFAGRRNEKDFLVAKLPLLTGCDIEEIAVGEERESNGILISKAPELLDTCKELVEILRHAGVPHMKPTTDKIMCAEQLIKEIENP